MLDDAPPWTRRFLTDNWDSIRRGSMPNGEWMPVEAPGSKPKARLIDALGCGHYGCVFATNTPGLVMKVSSDPSEAEFIQAALKIGEWPEGIVKYQAIQEIPGSFKGRPVFVIWREEAYDLGKLDMSHYAYREFAAYHEAYLNAARVIREMSRKPTFAKQLAEAKSRFDDWAWRNVIWEDGQPVRRGYGMTADPPFMRYRGAQRLAAVLRICHICFEMMENTAYGTAVGGALAFYLDRGILLADVHFNNVGTVTRADPDYPGDTNKLLVITDPGHAVFLAR